MHLPVDHFEYASVPGAVGGKRVRLAALLQALIAKLPHAKQLGLVEQALAKTTLDAIKPLPSTAHKRRVMAWLTARRCWPV